MLNIAWVMVTVVFPFVSLIGSFIGIISKRVGSKGLMVTTLIWIVAIIIFPSLRMPWYAENFGFSKKSTPENTVTTVESKTTSESFKMEDFVLQVGSKDITVNHEALTLNAPFVEIDGHSYIPLRFFLDWFGAENIVYDAKTERIMFLMNRLVRYIKKEEDNKTIEAMETENYILQVGSKDITINNEPLTLNAPIVEIDGHSYLPLRFFLNRFSAEKIAYDEKTEKVSFSMKRYGLLGSDVKNKYRRKESYEVVKIAQIPKEETEEIPASKSSALETPSVNTHTYDQLARNPDVYKGFQVRLTGKVVQVIEAGKNKTQLRVNITKDEYSWSDAVFVSYTRKENEIRILEDDIITLWGIYEGLITYKAVLGQNITIPSISAKNIDIN